MGRCFSEWIVVVSADVSTRGPPIMVGREFVMPSHKPADGGTLHHYGALETQAATNNLSPVLYMGFLHSHWHAGGMVNSTRSHLMIV